jgi:predicted amidohydrolase
MRVTVCELSDNEVRFIDDWTRLKTHLKTYKPDLLLLPEMPFGKWIASERNVDEAGKVASIQKHGQWMKELEQLKVRYTVYSKPVLDGDKFYNTAFVYEKGVGHSKIHTKALFPEEEHFWEASWFDHEEIPLFKPLDIGGIKIGVLLCTEMWFTEHAREYGKQGVDLLLCPRATGMESVNQWLRCGQTLSVISGAYCLSSNRSGLGGNDFQWGGMGWITKPMNGNTLGVTSADEKFITRDLDMSRSKAAKDDYPLYVNDI